MHADVLRRDVEQLLRDAGREPLPSLPGVPTGPTPTLDSLARTVANETGLYSATERAMQTAQAAVASGNFTQVRCAFLGWCIHPFAITRWIPACASHFCMQPAMPATAL